MPHAFRKGATVILGIDIGGTHTDAVCISGSGVVATAKVITQKDRLVTSIMDSIKALDVDMGAITRVVLSTTLSTNAIVEDRLNPTGMIISAGPGIDPVNYFLNDNSYLVSGAIDHRGRAYMPISEKAVIGVSEKLREKAIDGVGIVSKFSPRNSVHEKTIGSLVSGDFRYITMGHRMSGALNFPRRINTTYFNTAVMPLQNKFMESVTQAFDGMGISADIFVLKADGGTITADAASHLPVETILSGPAASIMGALALYTKDVGTAVVLDIGGTTTDIGLLVKGVPVMEYKGVSIGGKKTLVRGLNLLSIGVGGDSTLYMEDGIVHIGPLRNGQPACMGGQKPTPTDALAIAGGFDHGDIAKAKESLLPLAGDMDKSVDEFSDAVLKSMAAKIHQATMSFIDKINSAPVYTIHDMLYPELVKPEKVIVIGAPSKSMLPYIRGVFDIPCIVPEYSGLANAIGAGLTRTTAQITLIADTYMKKVICPELDIEHGIPSSYTLKDMKDFGLNKLKDYAQYLGIDESSDVDIVEEQSFNMVRGFSTIGKNIRLKLQTRPGILPVWDKGI